MRKKIAAGVVLAGVSTVAFVSPAQAWTSYTETKIVAYYDMQYVVTTVESLDNVTCDVLEITPHDPTNRYGPNTALLSCPDPRGEQSPTLTVRDRPEAYPYVGMTQVLDDVQYLRSRTETQVVPITRTVYKPPAPWERILVGHKRVYRAGVKVTAKCVVDFKVNSRVDLTCSHPKYGQTSIRAHRPTANIGDKITVRRVFFPHPHYRNVPVYRWVQR